MSGSPPASPGELHPNRQSPSATRNWSSTLQLAAAPPADTRRVFRPPSPSALTRVGTPADKCLHVLSSFQRTGRSLLPIGLLTLRSPPRLFPSGEPSNLTRSFLFVSTPGDSFRRRRFNGGRHRSRRSAAPENRLGVYLKDDVRGKKICLGFDPKQIFQPTWPGHARFIQYTRRARSCQPRPFIVPNGRTAHRVLSI
jgi:hypothetical protein